MLPIIQITGIIGYVSTPLNTIFKAKGALAQHEVMAQHSTFIFALEGNHQSTGLLLLKLLFPSASTKEADNQIDNLFKLAIETTKKAIGDDLIYVHPRGITIAHKTILNRTIPGYVDPVISKTYDKNGGTDLLTVIEKGVHNHFDIECTAALNGITIVPKR